MVLKVGWDKLLHKQASRMAHADPFMVDQRQRTAKETKRHLSLSFFFSRYKRAVIQQYHNTISPPISGMAPLPAGYSSRNDSSLSLRTRRNMNEEEEHLIDQDFTEQDHFLEKETTNATRRARGFWDVDEDFDDEELGEPHHHHQIQHKRVKNTLIYFHVLYADNVLCRVYGFIYDLHSLALALVYFS